MKMTLHNSKQGVSQMRHLWGKMKEALDSGLILIIEVKREGKTRQQEKLYHEYIGQIAEQAKHLGSSWNPKSWKRLLVDSYATDTGQGSSEIIPNLSGDGIVQLGLQTRDFSKAQASEFTEWLMAWAAQNGVTLHD